MSRPSATSRRKPDPTHPSDTQSERLTILEVEVAVIRRSLDAQSARMAQMQAQIDRLMANDRNNEEGRPAEGATPTV